MSARKLPDGGEVVVLGDIDDDTLKAAITVMRNEYRRRGLHERKPAPSEALKLAIERGEVIPERGAKPEPWIVSRPGVQNGEPHVRGCERITVRTIQRIAHELTALEILKANPGLTAEGLAAALAYRLPKAKRGGRRS